MSVTRKRSDVSNASVFSASWKRSEVSNYSRKSRQDNASELVDCRHLREELEHFARTALRASLLELRLEIGSDISTLLRETAAVTDRMSVYSKPAVGFHSMASGPITFTSVVSSPINEDAIQEEETFDDIVDEDTHLESKSLIPLRPWRVCKGGPYTSEEARDIALLPESIAHTSEENQARRGFSLAAFMNNTSVNVVSTMLVVANAILIGVQTEYMAQPEHLGKEEPSQLRIADLVFCVVFSAELLLRLVSYGLEFFTSPDWRWNVFDMLVVGIQLLDQILHFVIGMGDITWLKILRLFRLLRIARVFRLVRFLQELRAMITSLLASLKTAVWALVLLLMVVYIFAVFFTEITTDYRSNARGSDDTLAGLNKYFGSLGLTTATLYESILSGISWGDATRHLRCISPFMEPFYMFFTAICLLAIMNAITGVFVEQAMLQTHAENDTNIAEQVMDLLSTSELNVDGVVTLDLFLHHANDREMQELVTYIDGDLTDPAALFRLIDLDDSGFITPEEFLIGCRRLRGPGKAIDLALVMREQTEMHASIWERLTSIENKLTELKDLHVKNGSAAANVLRQTIAKLQTLERQAPYEARHGFRDLLARTPMDSHTVQKIRSSVRRPTLQRQSTGVT